MLTVTDRSRLESLGAGLALAVGLIGLTLTNRPVGVKTSFVFFVALGAMLVPLIWQGLDVAEVCNWVFYAVSAVLLYYLIAGGCGGCSAGCVVARRRAAAATTAALALLAIAGISSARGEETPRIDAEMVSRRRR